MNLSDNRFGFVHFDEAGLGIIDLIFSFTNIKTFDFSYISLTFINDHPSRSSWLTQIVFRYRIIFESIVMAYNIDIEFDLGVFMRLKLIFVIFLYLNGYNNSNPFAREICVPDMSREVKYGNEQNNPVSICVRLTW
jgi:hypothetical protein